MPACLIELAFIDTVADAEILRTKHGEMARAIAKGFFELLGIKENPPVIPNTSSNSNTPNRNTGDRNIDIMASLGVMKSPEYWQNQKLEGLDELL